MLILKSMLIYSQYIKFIRKNILAHFGYFLDPLMKVYHFIECSERIWESFYTVVAKGRTRTA